MAAAIVEHYYPHAPLPGDSLSRPGLALNLANRLDSLGGLFAVGKAPTGSADPFALRRDALSLTQRYIFSARKLAVPLKLVNTNLMVQSPAYPEVVASLPLDSRPLEYT